MKALITTKTLLLLTTLTVLGAGALGVHANRKYLAKLSSELLEYREASQSIVIQPTPTPNLLPTSTTAVIPPQNGAARAVTTPYPVADQTPWGVAQKVDDVTYSIKVGEDPNMATPAEVLTALNNYRNVHGTHSLAWDEKLAQYAQSRAEEFQRIGSTDKHAGFNEFLSNKNGFDQLGFMRVGENSYYGGKLSGVHMIEWVFSQSPGHNANQLSAQWTHVGIGVTNVSANLIFGSHN